MNTQIKTKNAKYALYYYTNRDVKNIGDSIQVIAMEEIYKQMGIAPEKTTYIPFTSLSTYDDDYILLPIFSGLENPSIPLKDMFSPKIIPVFIAYVTFKPVSTEDASFLKKYEPIGCRDRFTYNELVKHGVRSYVNGCITLTLPERTSPPRGGGGGIPG